MTHDDMNMGNPAWRLFMLLDELHNHVRETQSSATLRSTWKKALVPTVAEDEDIAAARVLGLVDEVDRALQAVGNGPMLRLFHRTLPALTGVIIPAVGSGAITEQGNRTSHIDADAMEHLEAVASFLDRVRPGVRVEDDEDLRLGFADQIADIRRDIERDGSVAEPAKSSIVDALHEVEWALRYYSVGGPEAVQHAAERTVGVLALSPQRMGGAQLIKEWGPLVVAILRLVLDFFFPGGAGLNQLGPLMDATGIEVGVSEGDSNSDVVEGEVVAEEPKE